MKNLYIPNELSRLKFVILLTILTFTFSSAIFSQDSKKSKPRMSLDYFNDADNSRTLAASLFIIKDRQRMPVNGYVNFYVGDISEDNLLDSIMTDENGQAHYIFPDDYVFPVDDERKATFTAQFNGNRSFSAKSDQIDVKEVSMELFLSEVNLKKTVCVRGYEKGSNNEMYPVEDVNVKFYVPRLFNDQEIGKSDIDGGKGQIEFPENIAGDTIGNITIIARIEDHDFYGNVERRVSDFRWGTNEPIDEDKSLMTIQITIPTRALWHTNAPLWMIVTLIILLAGVWGHYIFVIFNLIKLKRLSNKKTIVDSSV